MPDPPIDYADVQGTILRGYRVDYARHFILKVHEAESARSMIGALADGRDGSLRIATAEHWTTKPESFINLGFTHRGLGALGLRADRLATFDRGFQRGATAAATAEIVGDVGEAAPSRWIGGLADGDSVHAVLSLWATRDRSALDSTTSALRAAFSGAFEELSAHDAEALPDNHVHFGYRDNIAQPTVQGAPPRKRSIPDDQDVVPTGEFLLGYPNASRGTYRVEPPELSKNGSYSAFRILEQDVEGFEAFLSSHAPAAGMDVETLAAKVCGRWRNGNPLVLSPDAPGDPMSPSAINDFRYISDDLARDDTLGLKCPIGSHIRRNNPRDAAVLGAGSVHHRIVRRAMPYGPPYDPARPIAAKRGLIGHFINASLTNQFEFLMAQWNNRSDFIKSAVGPDPSCPGNAVFNISGDDPFIGVNDPATSSFTIAACGARGANNTRIAGFAPMVVTRGGAYCFFPSVTGLRYLAAGAASA